MSWRITLFLKKHISLRQPFQWLLHALTLLLKCIFSPCIHSKHFFNSLVKPDYPFSFALAERKSVQKELGPNYYWESRKSFKPRQVYLIFSQQSLTEWWFLSGLFAALPILLWYLLSEQVIIPVNPFVSELIGILPFVMWRLCNSQFPKNGIFPTFWGYIPLTLQSWVTTIIRTPENVSPIRWATDSEDEILLRYILISYFSALDKNRDKKIISWRIISGFFSPIVIAIFSLYLQMIYWLPHDKNGASADIFGTITIIWLVISYAYAELQLIRIYDQIYVKPSMASQKLPAIIVETLPFNRKDISRPAIRYGIPSILAAVTTITISFQRVIF